MRSTYDLSGEGEGWLGSTLRGPVWRGTLAMIAE
jgi:hypothetical protein